MTSPQGPTMDAAKVKIGNFRWTICALLFFATTINYIDRQVLGILAPTLQEEIGWSEIEYGYIVTSFQAAYAIGMLLVGRLLDRFGTRLGFSLAVIIWSIAAMGHAAARSVIGFAVARFSLGIGESGNFPASIKTVAEWFPRRDRALATGIFNAGSNVGAIVAPLVVPWLTLTYGWEMAFIATGALGFFWVVLWLLFYQKPESSRFLSKPELAYINSDKEVGTRRIPYLELIRHKQAWAFAIGKFMTDPIWWFYLYWVPKFLYSTYGIKLEGLGPPLVVIYLLADVGSVGGGWLSSSFIRRGWSVNRGRKTAMLVCALCVVPIVFASQASELWIAVALLGLATAAHQGWSANLFTTASDMFPKEAVGSVVGFGGMAGAVGGMLISTLAGILLEFTGSYMTLFILAGSVYLCALVVIHWLAPSLEPAKLENNPA